jgi:nitroreductase
MDLASIDHVLTTTRSVKKRLDFSRPVDPEVIQRCIEIALQSPTGVNSQGWYFLVVTDPAKRLALGEVYRRAMRDYIEFQNQQPPQYPTDSLRAGQWQRMLDASMYLNERVHEAPVHIIPCINTQVKDYPLLFRSPTPSSFYHASLYGSILPAAWSLMLALRARGLGSAWTTVHLVYEKEAAEILDIPDTILQVALLPVAHFTGDDFRPAKRLPVEEVTYWNGWGRQR